MMLDSDRYSKEEQSDGGAHEIIVDRDTYSQEE